MNAPRKTDEMPMLDAWLGKMLARTNQHYIVLMMIGTRIFGSLGGLLVIYYVELALTLPTSIRVHFRGSSIVVVVLGCTLTVLLALWETRALRGVLKLLGEGRPVSPEALAGAAHEATAFGGRHHRHEAWLVPCSTLLPVLIVLYLLDGASATVLTTISLTVFMGISMALMSTFFAVEKAIQPVVRRLLDAGARPDFAAMRGGRLYFRFGLCSALIIMTTALMISLLARHRATEIMTASGVDSRQEAVAALLSHSVYITIAAVLTGVVYSQVLTHSVSSRVESLVAVMDRVAAGHLSERLQPTGTDEIDRLARRFNTMVDTLQHNHHTIHDLNSNLEDKVRQRTTQLEDALRRLRDTQTQMTDLARRAGMAEVATGVLHNVGNVLNTINVSADCLGDRLRKSRSGDLQRFVDNLTAHEDLGGFFADGVRAEKTLKYLHRLATLMKDDNDTMQGEVRCLTDKIGHVKGIINTQQSYARRVTFREEIDLAELLNEILSMYAPRLRKHAVDVETDLPANITAVIEKANLVQVFDNLIRNAIDAMVDRSEGSRRLSIQLRRCRTEQAEIRVSDSGCGVSEADLKRIFTYGYTTKSDGNGFGLHSSALAVSAVDGRIAVDSPGAGRGTTFTVVLPLQPQQERQTDDDDQKKSATNRAAAELTLA